MKTESGYQAIGEGENESDPPRFESGVQKQSQENSAATGPWRYDAPPTVNDLLLMKIRAIGSPCISLYYSEEISRWFVQSVGFVSAKDIICWAEINMPEGRRK